MSVEGNSFVTSNVHQIPRTTIPPEPPSNIINFSAHIQGRDAASAKPWHEYAIAELDTCEQSLDALVPNSVVQNKITQIGQAIEKVFAPLKKFSDWLDKNEMGSWYKQLAIFLVKLPMQAVRNIVRLLYSIIKGIFYAVVHPMKAAVHLAKFLVRLAHEFTKPETWSKMGAGILGANVGHALVTGNPFSVIGLGIGAGMVAGGISIGMLKAALEDENGNRWGAVKEHLFVQLKALPEAALTGFVMGLIMGGIDRTVRGTALAKIDDYVNQLIQENKLPPSTQWSFDPSTGKITLNVPWDGSVPALVQAHTGVAHGNSWFQGVKIEILPTSTKVTVIGKGWTFLDAIEVSDVEYTLPNSIFEHIGQGYPSTLLPQSASPLVAAAGAATAIKA